MSDDLVERLRDAAFLAFDDGTNDYGTPVEAADRIEALTAELTLAEQRGYANAMEAERKLHEDRIEALTEQLEQLVAINEAACADAKEAEAYAEDLEKELVEWRADSAAGWDKCEEHRIKLAKAVEALRDMCAEFRGYDLPYGSKAYVKATTTLAKIENSEAVTLGEKT